MNVLLWGMQIILAIKVITVTFTHGLRKDPVKMQREVQRLGAWARSILALVAACTLLCGLLLVLPAATGIGVWITPWSAAVLAGLMAASIGFHIQCRERPNIIVSLVLSGMAAFLAYGRWVLAPL